MTNVKNHLYPQTIEKLLELIQDQNSQILAGGTDLSLNINQNTQTLVDLQDLPLKYIKESNDEFTIGSLTTAYEIWKAKNLPQSLRECAFKVSDMPLLHAVTIGGNLARLYPWCDLPPMLWALNAEISIYEQDGSFVRYSADSFFAYSKEQNVSNRNSFIKEISIPKPPQNTFSQYQKFGQTEIDKGQVNLASYLSWNNEKIITEVRFAISAITKSIQRLGKVEEFIRGKKLSNELIKKCEDIAVSSIEIVPNYKSSVDFRSQILRTYIRRTMRACMEVQ